MRKELRVLCTVLVSYLKGAKDMLRMLLSNRKRERMIDGQEVNPILLQIRRSDRLCTTEKDRRELGLQALLSRWMWMLWSLCLRRWLILNDPGCLQRRSIDARVLSEARRCQRGRQQARDRVWYEEGIGT